MYNILQQLINECFATILEMWTAHISSALCVCCLYLLVEMKADPDMVLIGQMKKRPAGDRGSVQGSVLTEQPSGQWNSKKTSQLGQKRDLDRFSLVA